MATVSLAQLQGLLTAGVDRAMLRNAAMFDQMGASLLASVRQGMQAETAPDGRQWQPLRPATVKKRGAAHPILRMRGHLYQSIAYHYDDEHAQVGTNMPYARIHQHGGVIQRGAGLSVLHFRRTKNGQVRFTRAGDKRARYGMKAAHGPYGINIPARPYLYNNDGTAPQHWKTPLVRIVMRTLAESLTQGGV